VSALKSARLSRRNFLRGLGGAAIALPLLNFVDAGRSHAGPPSFPKRIVFWYTPDGTIQNAWWPTGTPAAFTLNRIMKPLEPFKQQLVILENLDMGVTYSGPGDMHQVGMGGLLTGRELQDGSLFVGAGGQATGWANGPSVDQYIASRLGQTTPFPSLELGVQVIGATVWTRMCYRAAAQPVPPESEPSRAFKRLFTSLGAPSDPASQALRSQRKSVLDGVSRDFAKLNARVSAADRVKLGAHLDVVRDIERRLDLGGGVLPAACSLPAAPSATLDTDQVGNFPAIGKLQMDLLVAALACDLTRVGSIQWSNAVSATVHTWLGATQGHHELSHTGDADEDERVVRAAARLLRREAAEHPRGERHDARQHRDRLRERAVGRQRAFALRHAVPAPRRLRRGHPRRALAALPDGDEPQRSARVAVPGDGAHRRHDVRQSQVLLRAAAGAPRDLTRHPG
jgi:hypothetical protein